MGTTRPFTITAQPLAGRKSPILVPGDQLTSGVYTIGHGEDEAHTNILRMRRRDAGSGTKLVSPRCALDA